MEFSQTIFCHGQDSSRPTTATSCSLSTVDPDVDDLYTKYKRLQKQLEFLKVQEEYIKDEQKNLKKELLHAQEEVKRIQSVPLVIGQFLEAVDQNTGIVGSTTGKEGFSFNAAFLLHIERAFMKHPQPTKNIFNSNDI